MNNLIRKSTIITLLTLLCVQTVSAYYHYISIWEKVDTNGQEHFIHCLSDIHIERPEISREQRKALISTITRVGKENSLVLVENSRTSDNIPLEWEAAQRLSHFNKHCEHNNIPVIAIDPRNYSYDFFNLIEDWTKQPSSFTENLEHNKQQCLTEYKAYKEEVIKIEKKLKKFNDGKTLNDYYSNLWQQFDKAYEFIEKIIALIQKLKPQQSVGEARKYIQEIQQAIHEITQYINDISFINYITATKEPLANLLDSFDSGYFNHLIAFLFRLANFSTILGNGFLFDINALHTLNAHRDKKHIFMCMGSDHTTITEAILPKLGYTQLKRLGKTVERVPQLKEFINEHDSENDLENYLYSHLPPLSIKDFNAFFIYKQNQKFSVVAKSLSILCVLASFSLGIYSYFRTKKLPPKENSIWSKFTHTTTLGFGILGLGALGAYAWLSK